VFGALFAGSQRAAEEHIHEAGGDRHSGKPRGPGMTAGKAALSDCLMRSKGLHDNRS
jgi:hypothetical protein